MGWNAPLNEKRHARDIEHETDVGGCAWTRARLSMFKNTIALLPPKVHTMPV